MSQSVRSAERILYIIQFLNQENGVTANHMAMATQISRAATHRMLETLRTLGFVRKDGEGKYWLEPQILSLSSGYSDDRELTDRLSPILHEYSEQIQWPLSVSTRAGNAMVIRASTDLESAVAARRRLVAGWPMPGLLNSAAGNVFLAFSDQATRDGLIDMIANEDESAISGDAQRQSLGERLDAVAASGYVNVTHAVTWNWVDRTSAMGVPIHVSERLFGALSMRYFRARLSDSEAVEQFLEPLQLAAVKIGAALQGEEQKEG